MHALLCEQPEKAHWTVPSFFPLTLVFTEDVLQPEPVLGPGNMAVSDPSPHTASVYVQGDRGFEWETDMVRWINRGVLCSGK
jgi:hypothetical protein